MKRKTRGYRLHLNKQQEVEEGGTQPNKKISPVCKISRYLSSDKTEYISHSSHDPQLLIHIPCTLPRNLNLQLSRVFLSLAVSDITLDHLSSFE